MSTNFYWHAKPACPTCGHEADDDVLHIGKSSAGWCFSLHVIPEKGITNLGEWQERFARPGSYIKDEYGDVVTPEDMLERITKRNGRPWEGRDYGPINLGKFTIDGYRDEAEFHRRNHSERGPNGLLRHRLGPYCVAHGEGTYDLIPGEFS